MAACLDIHVQAMAPTDDHHQVLMLVRRRGGDDQVFLGLEALKDSLKVPPGVKFPSGGPWRFCWDGHQVATLL
jgi:hypothetical protein